ncbi:MAG: N-acetylglucosamine kinase [Sphingobacteriales bacterium 17-39-43]|uniref:N-acetylglucosamine kinase n=1 Tax=Daejeonella sp. TaxID=2805397 RepID=UPI000BD3A9DE|nr:N-acetylglucosamine kinase [Daejeonella sp.]OYZ30876.1 MAG: N-acetylglucosamine kinase [Sphingobacteriales bacterium 16-39-50]OZA23662.1 MAG: N-acetylglucosamine kinase [Sphingobacteriales bacterium 17-39-43]HQT23473.1 N-acetylglucosamine kinase [Daejeonella sp.]HQT58350.1 N-acetylglucosamine kinase [Daejeonella sp.]
MLLVADSGSSKADWILTISDTETIPFRTSGINPFFLSEKDIIKIFQNTPEIQPYTDQVKEIYFFGAGCSSPDRREHISNALSKIFKHAFVSVDIDIIASIYATAGNSKGICCIIGTGSNITYFDGSKIHESKHGLGYILGDEGSGTWLGRQLITSFLYGKMPADLSDSFKKNYKIDKESVIKHVYQQPAPNFYLASFAPFLSEHIGHPFIVDVLKKGFSEFIETNIKSYPDYKDQTCHFVGSIAYHFSDILKELCTANEIKVGKILKHPIEELSRFILKNGI